MRNSYYLNPENMRQILLIIAVILCGLTAIAQTKSGQYKLIGKIRSSTNHSPISNATVRVLNSNQGTTTDPTGQFTLQFSSPGPHSIQFTSVSYSSEVKTIVVGESANVLDILLQPAIIQLNDQIVVTAQRYETRSFDRPEAITAVSHREIARNATRSTPELLLGQSGVFLQKTNHGGGSPFVRGLTGQQTLLLVDGIRLNNATFRSGPNQYLNTLDPLILDRIEVLRGGGSVQYGSDALGGTINVLTASPEFSDRPRFNGKEQVKLTTGGMEKSGRVSLGYSTAVASVSGGFSYWSFGDLIGGKGIGKQIPTGYSQYAFDLKSLIKINPNLRLTVAVQHLQQDSVPVYHKVQLENFAFNQFNPQSRSMFYARLEGFKDSKWLKYWQLTPLIVKTLEERQSRKNTVVRTLTEKDEVTTHGILASVHSAPTAFWTIQSGIEWYFDRVGSQKQEVEPIWSSALPPPVQRGLYPDNSTMSNLGIYTLHSFQWTKWLITAGGRYNSFVITIPDSDLGVTTLKSSALVGNAGIAYSLFPFLKLVANVNSSFRAPNIDDLGTLGIVDFRYEVPNNSLKPERGFSKELGMKLRTGSFSSSLFMYQNQLRDLIGRIKTSEIKQGYPVYLKENISSAIIRGMEADAEWQLAPRWMLAGYINYTYGQNLTGNEPYRRIPPLNGKLTLNVQPTQNTWLRLNYFTAAKQTRLAGGDRDDNRIPEGGTPGWKVVNAGAGYQIGKWQLSAELQNLFNEAYRMHGSGVSEVGRSAWVRVSFAW